jgi:hypothetical protein
MGDRRADGARVSVLDELTQPAKRVVPLLGNCAEVVACVLQPPAVQLPDALAPVPRTSHQACFLHHTQVFSDGLPSDMEAHGEAHDRQRSVIAEARDKT